jgi:hypothetical protein
VTIPTISSAQTQARQPINEALMDALRQRSTYTPLGTIVWVYDFNGLIATPEGYMLCSGTTVSQENYDVQHAARSGTWAVEVGSSPLAGRHLPNLVDRYLTHGAATQSGFSEITSKGAASNLLDINHTHSVAGHNHQWFGSQDVPPPPPNRTYKVHTYQSNGNELTQPFYDHTPYHGGGTLSISETSTTNGIRSKSLYTSNKTLTTNNQNTNDEINVQPDSIVAKAWIRII